MALRRALEGAAFVLGLDQRHTLEAFRASVAPYKTKAYVKSA